MAREDVPELMHRYESDETEWMWRGSGVGVGVGRTTRFVVRRMPTQTRAVEALERLLQRPRIVFEKMVQLSGARVEYRRAARVVASEGDIVSAESNRRMQMAECALERALRELEDAKRSVAYK